jgi:hypothetical protein
MMEQGAPLLSIRVENVTRAEYMEAYKAAARRASRVPMGVYTLFLFMIFFLGYWLSQRDLPSVGILVAICILSWISYQWLRWRSLRESRDRFNAALPAQITFTENGILGQIRDSEGFSMWQHYEGFIEAKSVFVLVPAHRSYSIVPKHALDSVVLGKMQELLSGKMKKL